MLVSFNLLKKYVNLPKGVSAYDVAQRLTESVVEVEDVMEQAKNLDNIVIGEVFSVEEHPNADKLKLAEVTVAKKEKVRVVCGGTNLRKGMKVIFAKVGAKVRWHGEGDLVELEPAVIRGEESEGMICAADELGLGDMFSHADSEIVDLADGDYKIGEPIAKAFGLDDFIIDIDNKSITNRPDLWGHYGLARELAAIYRVELVSFEMDEDESLSSGKNGVLEVDVEDKEMCPIYVGAQIDNVKIEESPDWIKNALNAVGVKSINNIVDITNFVMIEMGQPMHAFDRRLLQSDKKNTAKIIVRHAKSEEKMKMLDEAEVEMDKDMLVIASEREAVALAGVMGGFESGISDDTKDIVFEAAVFDSVAIRKTARKTGIRTDSAMRFEKSLDPEQAEKAIRRAIYLLREILPDAEVSNGIVVSKVESKNDIVIDFSLQFLQKKSGLDLTSDEVADVLHRLGFEIIRRVSVEKKDDIVLKVRVPSFRSTGDISTRDDLVEEVVRIYGYSKIEAQMPKMEILPIERENELKLIDKFRDIFIGNGFSEVYNYSFIPKRAVNKEYLDEDLVIKVSNPLSSDQEYLRTDLIFGLMKNAHDNSRFRESFGLFEVGRVFRANAGEYFAGNKKKNKLYSQPYHAGMVVVGDDERDLFFELKGAVQNFLKFLFADIEFMPASGLVLSSEGVNVIELEKSLSVLVAGERVGYMGVVSDDAKKVFKIKNKKVVMAEIDLSNLLSFKLKEKSYEKIEKYPAIKRDISIEVDKGLFWSSVKMSALNASDLVKEVEILSEYDLGFKKSLAFRVIYQSDERTLEDADVSNGAEKEVMRALEKDFGAKRR